MSQIKIAKDFFGNLSGFFSRRDKSALILVILITFFLSVLDLVGILLIGVISSLSITGISTGQRGDRVSKVLQFLRLEESSLELQVIVIGIMASIALIMKTIVSMWLVRKSMFFMARRAASVSANLVSKYFTVPVSKINQLTAQTSIFAITDGVTRIMVGVVGACISLFSDLALLIVLGIGLFALDPITAIFSGFIFIGLALYLYLRMHKKVRYIGAQVGYLNIESSQRIFEAINCYRELLVKNRRDFYARKIGKIRYDLADKQATVSYMTNLSKYVLEIALVFGALGVAFYQFANNSAFRAIATLTVFVAASTRLIPAILRLQQGFLGMRASISESKPTIDLMRELSQVESRNILNQDFTKDHLDFVARIEIKGVSFGYVSSSQILNNITMKANPGEFVGIVGTTGSGKSTLIDVMLGALDPDSGEVMISGLSPTATYAKWPGAVSYVPQDCPIINGTIRENIALGYKVEEIPEDFFWESLKLAQLDEFVMGLELKLDSYVGDRGTKLSGGQKQRLGIARALLTSPRLLILDEATSSLDVTTEHEVSESLRNIREKTTLVVVAHRLSTIQQADRIYYVDQGSISSIGNFQELKSLEPKFSEQAGLLGL